MFPGVELLGTDALACLEGLDVVSPAFAVPSVADAAKRVLFFLYVCLG